MSDIGLFKEQIIGNPEAAASIKEWGNVSQVDKNKKTIFWLHFALIVPLLAYIGFKRDKAHPRAYDLLLALTAFTAVYHGVRVISTSH